MPASSREPRTWRHASAIRTKSTGRANFHLPWAAMAIAIIAPGPGRLSLDHVVAGMLTKADKKG
jgi:uncharacterized membrane protein YphA (DoxX/SURF4 family)